MYHKYKNLGLVMFGAGAGMLFACLFQSGVLCALGGIGLLVAGFLLLRK